jgi:hypothetical protein
MPSLVETVALIGASIVQTFGVRVGAEQPRYVVLERAGPVEIRRYEPRIAAETSVAGDPIPARNEGFRRIAGYIFGGNQGKASIAMTSPVVQGRAAPEQIAMTSPVVQARGEGGTWKVQFLMPSKYAMADLPKPNDSAVKLVELPTQTYAVMRFAGSRSATTVNRKTAELLAALKAQGRVVEGEPVAWFYDPPWTIPLVRRNEVAAPLALRPGP